jgi:hypothetical protein
MAQQNETAHNSEYEALRAELLSLNERTFNTWRWGLLELVSLTGLVVIQVATLATSDNVDLRQISPCWVLGIFIILYALGTSIGYVEARTAERLENAADRIGAFLAVFHDGQPPRVDNFGWHAWNRIERFTRRPEERVTDPLLSDN